MEDSFPTELWQAGEAWVSGVYVKTPLNSSLDLQGPIQAGKNFWIPADQEWLKLYAIRIVAVFLVFWFIWVWFWNNGIFWGMGAVLCAAGAPIARYLHTRQFIAIGPSGILYRGPIRTIAIQWTDLTDVDLVYVKREEDMEAGGVIPPHYKEEIQCTFLSGKTKIFGFEGYNRDEVNSFSMFMNLFFAYWVPFRDRKRE